MATNFLNTTDYSGESAGKYIGAALLSANTIENGGLTVMPNVKYRSTIKKVDTANLIADASCDFEATGDITLTDRAIEPKELQVNAVLCRKDFRDDYNAITMGYSVYDTLPPNFQEFMIARMLGHVAEATENQLFTGTGGAGQFEGFNPILAAAVLAGDVPAAQALTGTTIDASNVIDELGSIVDALPSSLYGKEAMKIYIPQNVARAYVRALGGFGSGGYGANGTNAQGTQWFNMGSGLSFDGVPLFVCNGQASNKIFATTSDNLYFGTGLQSDAQEVKLIDMSQFDGSQNMRFVMRYTAGVQVGVLEDVVTYGL